MYIHMTLGGEYITGVTSKNKVARVGHFYINFRQSFHSNCNGNTRESKILAREYMIINHVYLYRSLKTDASYCILKKYVSKFFIIHIFSQYINIYLLWIISRL